ncbi:hypothetical protein ACFQYP_55865 [Nonomuraea antimicrobica]
MIAPHNITEIWAVAIVLLRRHPLQFVGSALVLTFASYLLQEAWRWMVTPLETAPDTDLGQYFQLQGLSALIGTAVSMAAFALTGALQAVLVVQAMVGRPVTVRGALHLLARRIRAVLGVTALLTVVPQLVVLGLVVALVAYFWPTLAPMLDALASSGDGLVPRCPTGCRPQEATASPPFPHLPHRTLSCPC